MGIAVNCWMQLRSRWHITWPGFRDAYQNGGFWGTPSGWVLPAVARTQPALARQMVRDAVADARRNGLNEWKNSAFSTGYAAGELTVPTGGYVSSSRTVHGPSPLSFVPPPRWRLFLAVRQHSSWQYPLHLLLPSASHAAFCLSCLSPPRPPFPPPPLLSTAPHRPPALTRRYEAFPMTGDWVGGAMNYGPNIGSVYRAAVLLLGPRPPPPPSPPTPPPGPAPANCSLTASWQFYAAAANATEVNGFVEAGNGTVVLTPGKNDGWNVATAVFHRDWSIDFKYFTSDFDGGGGGGGGGAPVLVHCAVHRDCLRIDCPRYTYTRIA